MNSCWQHTKQNHIVPISKIVSKFVNKMTSKLQNDHKNICIRYMCTLTIFLQWCCKSMKRSAKGMCMKKYIYNDYISTMIHAFDSDTYNPNIYMHVYQLICAVHIHVCWWEHEFERMSKSWIVVCHNSIVTKISWKSYMYRKKMCVEFFDAVWKRKRKVWYENVLDWSCEHSSLLSLGNQDRNYREQIRHFLAS